MTLTIPELSLVVLVGVSGSRAVVIVCRDEDAARRCFGVTGGGFGICDTRTGRHWRASRWTQGFEVRLPIPVAPPPARPAVQARKAARVQQRPRKETLVTRTRPATLAACSG